MTNKMLPAAMIRATKIQHGTLRSIAESVPTTNQHALSACLFAYSILTDEQMEQVWAKVVADNNPRKGKVKP